MTGYELRLKDDSGPSWDLPCLCYQAYSFIGRPICVGLLPLDTPQACV